VENAVLKECVLSSFLNMAGLAAARMSGVICTDLPSSKNPITTRRQQQQDCNYGTVQHPVHHTYLLDSSEME